MKSRAKKKKDVYIRLFYEVFVIILQRLTVISGRRRSLHDANHCQDIVRQKLSLSPGKLRSGYEAIKFMKLVVIVKVFCAMLFIVFFPFRSFERKGKRLPDGTTGITFKEPQIHVSTSVTSTPDIREYIQVPSFSAEGEFGTRKTYAVTLRNSVEMCNPPLNNDILSACIERNYTSSV